MKKIIFYNVAQLRNSPSKINGERESQAHLSFGAKEIGTPKKSSFSSRKSCLTKDSEGVLNTDVS